MAKGTVARRLAIDADGHIYENDEILLDYLPEPYRGKRDMLAMPFFATLDGFHRIARRLTDGREAPVPPSDPDTWLQILERSGLESTVLYPTAGLAIGLTKDPVWAAALCQGYNNFLHERYIQRSPRLKAVALLPLQNVPAAVQELRRAVKKLGMVGGILPAAGLRRALGEPQFHPLYEEAQKLDCPLTVHGAPSQNLGLEVFDSMIETRTLSHPIAQLIQVTSMIFQGVPELFPRLRLAFVEAGAGWVPYMMDRLDMEYHHRARQVPLLKKKPSEYLTSGNIYFHCEADESTLPYVIRRLGEDALLFASDYPHELELDEAMEELWERTDIPESVKRKILYENPKRFYRLD